MSTTRRIGLLLFFVGVCAGAALVRYRADAELGRVDPADLYTVVTRQLKALHANDFTAAYAHASNGLQQKFNLVQFTEMIRTDYPKIAHADHVEFGSIEFHDRHALIQVYFIDRNSQVIPCIYTLVNEGDGWRVDGVQILQRGHSKLMLSGILS